MGDIYCKTLSVTGFEGAIHGMRAPMQSYHLSDSKYVFNKDTQKIEYQIGEKDMSLCQRLINGGTEHRKYLRMIHVQAEIAMPRYWFSEYDTYKIGTVANSESTMHKLLNNKNPITEEQFYYGNGLVADEVRDSILPVIAKLEQMRKAYKEIEKNEYSNFTKLELLVMAKRILPECFIQVRTVDLNYETVKTIYRQRKEHRLKEEWQDVFCKWVENLPYFKELINFEDMEKANEKDN